MADNMESFLLGGDDDSSSGDSDAGGNGDPGTASAPSAAVQPPPTAAAPLAAAPGPSPATYPPHRSSSHQQQSQSSEADLSQRLGTLYSPATSRAQQSKSQPAQGSSQHGPPSPQAMPTQQRSSTSHIPQPNQIRPSSSQPLPYNQASLPQNRRSLSSASTVMANNYNRSSTTPRSAQHPQPPSTDSSQQRGMGITGVPKVDLANRKVSGDPYAPTPVSRIIEKSQRKTSGRQAVAASISSSQVPGGQQLGYSQPQTVQYPANSSLDQQETLKREKEQKERFIIFTRVLLKYLEKKDPQVHARAKAVIKTCAERNKRRQPGFESVTNSMRVHLKRVVDEAYWKRAEEHLEHFLRTKRKNSGQISGIISQNAPSAPVQAKPIHADLQDTQRQHPTKQQDASSATPAVSSTSRHTMGYQQASSKKSSSEAPGSTSTAQRSTSGSKVASKGKSTGKRSKATTSTPSHVRKTSNISSDIGPASLNKDTAQQREYSEFMEMIHHAVDFEWTKAGLSLGPGSIDQLSQEQHNLLESSTVSVISPLQVPVFPVPGWGERNVVSTRTAWARVRLREQRANTSASSATSSQEVPNMGQWRNEATAEARDPVLALISEGVQHYLRSVLEKGLHCARQRQNVDGIRLWHQQVTSADGATENPLSLRLGCDVSRQFAQEQGNAAMIIKRMEEALGRQSDVPRSDREMTMNAITEATSMTDLSLKPVFSTEDAEHNGKRSFEVYGGIVAGEPPLGRVSKQARLMVEDFLVAQHLEPRFDRHRAAAVSHCIAFF